MKHLLSELIVELDTSHPVRVRGLKLNFVDGKARVLMSHPVRVRGLKHPICQMEADLLPSHPVRVRGLKRLDIIRISLKPCRTPCGCVD
mgnify:CR=1 FL=1